MRPVLGNLDLSTLKSVRRHLLRIFDKWLGHDLQFIHSAVDIANRLEAVDELVALDGLHLPVLRGHVARHGVRGRGQDHFLLRALVTLRADRLVLLQDRGAEVGVPRTLVHD